MNGQYRIGDTVMKNWVIQKKLGEGSFGKVYEIERRDFGETYRAALKIITVPQNSAEIQAALEEGMSPQEAEQYFYSMVEDIVREFALMARVKGTAHVVSYEDHEVVRHEQGLGWDILIRMEELTPLLTYAYAHPFTRRDVIRLGIHMCKGLELCQKYNIIHRDIKPENIFVSENGDFKLGDFGIARTVEKTMSGLSKKGTYNYMAPEVYKGLEYGFSVDIYSLGIVLYRLLNKNRVPFLPPAPEKLTYTSREQALARRMSGDELPCPFYGQGRLGEIVLKAAAYRPGDRYSSPGQMRQELEAILYSEEDASIIYPEGDEISLKENIYATMNRGGAKERKSTDDAARRAEETRQRDSAAREEDGTEKTQSVFSESRKVSGENGKLSESGRTSGKAAGGKKGILAVAAVIAAAAVIGGVIRLGTGDRPSGPSGQGGDPAGLTGQDSREEADSELYTQLVSEASAVFDSDPAGAMEMMDSALALCPDQNGAQTDYAYALYRTGAYDDCISYVENDLTLGEGFDDAELKSELIEILAAAYYEKADYAGAASYFRLSAAGSDMSESAMRDYAVCLARLGSSGEAKDVLAQLRQKGANSDVTRYVEGEVAYANQDYTEAEKIFLELLEEGEEESILQRAFRSLVQLYHDSASHEEIAAAYMKEVDLLRTGITAYNLIYDTSLYEMLGQAAYQAYLQTMDPAYLYFAADGFEKVLSLGMQKEYLYTNLYTIRYELGEYTAAEEVLDRMEEAFPKSYVSHALRGILLITTENAKEEGERDYQAAREEYTKARELLGSSDDRTYYEQLESLIIQLEQQGW